MASAHGFSYQVCGSEVVISHRGRQATVLRGESARRFLGEIKQSDAQQLMARTTGNYKRGNEGTAKRHPRNAGS